MSFALFASPALEFLPRVADPARAALGFQHWQEALARSEDPELAQALQTLSQAPEVNSLLKGLFANSPFLGDCLLSDTQNLPLLVNEGPTSLLDKAFARLKDPTIQADLQACKVTLRQVRRQAALAIGLADILRLWDVDRCTEALSELADLSLRLALATLLRQAASRGEIALKNAADPLAGCGYVVLGLGKLGARELNYSSDIDLIVIYDPTAIDYRGSKGLPEFTVRLTQGLVQLLSERTADGYAFRVDLRLRPDPGATPLAISYAAAMTYYESMGQNWERAAMIKARPSAGDLALGAQFLKELRPFMWRRSLDFLAIQDIHSIKRQIHALKGGATIAVEGHNIKLGRGGIREIEFFAQTQQLIWGGRNPALRSPSTKTAIRALAAAGHVKAETAEGLCQSYDFLRRVEHRLQMVADQQTHSLPSAPADMESLAAFLSYPDVESFRAELLIHLHRVEDHYAELFEESPSLAGPGNLVFTGGEPEPGTVETLTKLGFLSPETVFNLVRAWHHGRYRAMRSQRARELLTEIMPSLLGAFGKSANPDAALAKFDEFLSGLPAGVQLFALLVANPTLLDLLAEVMGSAPALADHLSRRPQLIDALLAPGFLDHLPDHAALSRELAERLATARDFQDVLDYVRRWAADRRFQAGLHLLRGLAPEARIGQALSDIAEASLQGLLPAVESEFARQHGRLPGGAFAVLAFGRLGSREMTVTSDLDLLFLYERAEGQSDGAKPLDAMTYYARLSQRFINAITAPTSEGQLYPVDMRLRPSGNAGPIATTLAGFERYQKNEAWTWEHMALTRARFIAGDKAFGEKVSASVKAILTAQRDPQKLLADVADMRLRLEKEKPARGPWDLRRRQGGLLDAEFLAQYLQLRHAHLVPEILGLSTDRIFEKAGEKGLLASKEAKALASTMRFERLIQAYLRLTLGDTFGVEEAGEQLRIGLARACAALDFAELSNKLEELTLVLRQSLEVHLLEPAIQLKEGKKE